MKTVTIKLKKNNIYSYVDNATYKFVDAAMDGEPERRQGAAASDSADRNDSTLIKQYCDRRDANLRSRLKFCLVDDMETPKVLTNDFLEDECYEFKFKLEDEFTKDELKSVLVRMDSYIKRGAMLSWMIGAGINPTDSEQALEIELSEIVSLLRGRPWGRRPMQPFGPAMFNYKSK